MLENKLTNKQIIQLGVAATKVMVKRLYDNGLAREDIAKFTGLTDKTVNKIMKDLSLD